MQQSFLGKPCSALGTSAHEAKLFGQTLQGQIWHQLKWCNMFFLAVQTWFSVNFRDYTYIHVYIFI